ncbi:PEP-CTERM sorting domain-containing protein [Desulfurivibrio alkaliphilus]|uniref:Ice-binding protein C-terminal domain-containing protein n=1 Tax=Desulfurivibrio alkaliphilus (strain DSM 19089 / UNIQEM U267 / AHT2) TaxID=589865 RepID=D6Z4K1_DESAT|nr:PEP-CTERM sorting domain-containing protein [Desulfurivibrio alkaliphilus]ADH86476.1 protein of unknown function DUF1555 [Desulfurivibrio alkaliphilus AHT 2]
MKGKKKYLALQLAATVMMAGLVANSNADAASIIMEGDYVRTAISNDGTLGYGGITSPGLQHDPTGTRTWGVEDYLTPGDPWEWFGVTTNETGTKGNNNNGWPNNIATTAGPTDLSGLTYDNHVTWAGLYSGYFTIEHEYMFNDDYERIDILTTIGALVDLTEVRFLRAIDPDPDVRTYGTYDTINSRGATGVAPEDFVNSQGAYTGLTLGLYSNSSITHNTGISSWWTTDPNFYLAGTDDGDGDYVIGLAFNIGSMLAGSSVVLNYSYVMGGTLDTVDLPDPPSPVSEPGTMLLFGAGLAGLAAVRRRNQLHS